MIQLQSTPSSSCNKSVKIRLVATCHLQTCYNLLKQLAASLWITIFYNQLPTGLSSTIRGVKTQKPCKRILIHRLVDNKSVARWQRFCGVVDAYHTSQQQWNINFGNHRRCYAMCIPVSPVICHNCHYRIVYHRFT